MAYTALPEILLLKRSIFRRRGALALTRRLIVLCFLSVRQSVRHSIPANPRILSFCNSCVAFCVMLCCVISFHVISCHVSCRVLSCPVMSCHVICHVVLCCVVSCQLSQYIMSKTCSVMLCHVMSSCVVLCHVVFCHVMLYCHHFSSSCRLKVFSVLFKKRFINLLFLSGGHENK